MSEARARPLARRAHLLGFACLVAALVLAVAWRSPAGAAGEPGKLVAEPVLRSAADGVERLFGASPQEAPGEVWGSSSRGIVRHSEAGGWERVPAPVGSGGEALSSFEVALGSLSGRTTPDGGVAMAMTVGRGAEAQKTFAVRDPGGSFRAIPVPPTTVLPAEEQLFTNAVGGMLFTPIEEAGHTGLFVVPPRGEAGVQTGVLHFNGSAWTREPICAAAAPSCEPGKLPSGFRVLAIDASGPGNAWLLARGAVSGNGVELFRRQGGGEWRQQSLGGGLGLLFGAETPATGVTVAPRAEGQPLTVTANGVWADATLKVKAETVGATFYYDIGRGEVTGSWCDAEGAGAALCKFPLGSELPETGRSFAWPPASSSEPYGRRAITGVGQGAMLNLAGSSFERIPLAGGQAGSEDGAALSAPEEGWLGSSEGPLRLTRQPAPAALKSWPVPFRRPLTAIAPQPGAPVGALSSQALAVGEQGQVARYLPGQGWVAESLLSAAGVRQTPRLRSVAWPQPGFAYAVGDGGAMWLWRASTDLWEPDPGAPPNLVRGNFTGIAFDPSEPDRGYAVGLQGLLLGFGRQWAHEELPAGLNPEVNFTSVAFAGNEALATYRFPGERPLSYTGGLLVNDGSGWRVEPEVGAMGVPVLVSGLPDGGAAVAYENGKVAERIAPGAPWALLPESAGGYPSALAAIREEGQVRVAISVDPGQTPGVGWSSDQEQLFSQPPPGQAPLLTEPYPLPMRGYLERQTATGWRDEQHEAFPVPSGSNPTDLPREPDPLLAMLMAPDGSGGWVVGGETGERVLLSKLSVQTAAVMRYGEGAAPPINSSTVPLPSPAPGVATFAIGGNAQCAAACADQVGTGIGPEEWLPAAVAKAATVPGVRGFIYTGPGVASAQGEEVNLANRLGTQLSRPAFAREEAAYARRLGSGAGSLPVFPVPASSDLDRSNGLATFASAFSGATPISEPELAQGNYSFDSPGTPSVRVVVLDYAGQSLPGGQRCWLAQQLAGAKLAGEPAIVAGNRDLGGRVEPEQLRAADAAEVVKTLVTGAPPPGCALPGGPAGASAYFFDFPEQNRAYRLTSGARSIPAFGSGTLGFVRPTETRTDFVGASGFLLASVGAPEPATNVAPVSVRLIPSIGELALEAADGTLLRRSAPALFRGLARRPRAGGSCAGISPASQCQALLPDPYIPIPSSCQGPACASGLFPEYRFVSSNPDIANFVKVDPASSNPRAVLLGPNEKPIPDPTSGLLCAFNAGTTTVTIEAGGLAYSTLVTVQKGSVQRPCGTVPLTNPPAAQPQLAVPPPPPAPAPAPTFSSGPGSLPPPPPPSPAPAPQPVPHPHPAPVASPFLPPAPVLTPVVAIVPPPPPPAAQTTPPSGTSPVTQPAVSPQPEEQEEAAFDLVHHMVTHRPLARASLARAPGRGGGGALPAYGLPLLALLAALAAAGLAAPRRRSPRLAHAQTIASRRPRR